MAPAPSYKGAREARIYMISEQSLGRTIEVVGFGCCCVAFAHLEDS